MINIPILQKFGIEYRQLEEVQKMHTCSNPYFSFHDDIFPGFSKNAVSQPRFSPAPYLHYLEPYRKTVIPDNSFSFLEEFNHISTVEMNFTEDYTFSFFLAKRHQFKTQLEILQMKLEDGSSFFTIGVRRNDSLFIKSDFLQRVIIIKTNISDSNWTYIEINFSTNKTSLEVRASSKSIEEELKKEILSFRKQTVKILKLDQMTTIKSFSFFKTNQVFWHYKRAKKNIIY